MKSLNLNSKASAARTKAAGQRGSRLTLAPEHETAPALATREDAETTVNQIVTTTITRNQIALELDRQITELRQRYEPRLQLCADALLQKTELLRAWAEANPAEFKGKKSIDFANAAIGWRTGTPKISLVRGWTWKRVLEALRPFGALYIRTKEEVAKDELIAQRKNHTEEELRNLGVKITQAESFFVDPHLTEIQNKQQSAETAAK